MMNLCSLVYDLNATMKDQPYRAKRQPMANAVAIILPAFLLCLGYYFDTDDQDTDNYILNVARHAFSCSPRFPNMVEELLSAFIVSLICVDPPPPHLLSLSTRLLSGWCSGCIFSGVGL
jgi:hypothetical protein